MHGHVLETHLFQEPSDLLGVYADIQGRPARGRPWNEIGHEKPSARLQEAQCFRVYGAGLSSS